MASVASFVGGNASTSAATCFWRSLLSVEPSMRAQRRCIAEHNRDSRSRYDVKLDTSCTDDSHLEVGPWQRSRGAYDDAVPLCDRELEQLADLQGEHPSKPKDNQG